MKNIIPFVLFLLVVSAGAEEQTQVKEDPITEEIAKGVPGPESEKPEDDKIAAGEDMTENTSDVADPEAANPVTQNAPDEIAKTELSPPEPLKNRKLSEAIEQFIPTESISADNAVPFPVDI